MRFKGYVSSSKVSAAKHKRVSAAIYAARTEAAANAIIRGK